MLKAYNLMPAASSVPSSDALFLVLLEPTNDTFSSKRLELLPNSSVKIGRQVSPKQPPTTDNGVFDSRVLSRQHAEIWTEHGKVRVLLCSIATTFLHQTLTV
jgi:hypothetical protein